MLGEDLAKINGLMKKHRRTSRYVSTFANIIYSIPDTSGEDKLTIADQFKQKFPKITIKNKEISVEKSLGGYEDNEDFSYQQIEINEIEERMLRKNMHYKFNLPLMDESDQIKRICQAFHSIRGNIDQSEFYDHVYDQYLKLGGGRSFEELREKIVSDIMYLVRYKDQKIKSS